MSRESMTAMLAGISDISGKPRLVANNTLRYDRADGATVWRLHHTDIVTRNVDGTFTLDSGGWRTVTTKDRINTYAPCRVGSQAGIWFVDGVPFYDGMTVDSNGKPLGNGADAATILQDAKAVKRKIAQFCTLVSTVDELPQPNAGDCWICSMFQREPSREGHQHEFNTVKNQSGPNGDTEHLMSHLDEKYLHGALLVNAMRWAGYTDSQIGLHYGMNLRDTFKRTLRRYLGRKLGIA
jgi:hypothetical protein